jgi:type VI secretion system protein ImpM
MRGNPPSCYGKLPARADFILRRLPRATAEHWDRWLQACIRHSRLALGPAWQDLFLVAPPWRLALPAGTCGEAALVGVMVPSVDAVGRCFPLLIAGEVATPVEPAALAVAGEHWFHAAETLALHALAEDFSLDLLDRPLPPLPTGRTMTRRADAIPGVERCWTDLASLAALPAALSRPMPPAGNPALWWTGGGTDFGPALAATEGLVAPDGFAALLDGDADSHGWSRWPGTTAPAGPDLAWDRDT